MDYLDILVENIVEETISNISEMSLGVIEKEISMVRRAMEKASKVERASLFARLQRLFHKKAELMRA